MAVYRPALAVTPHHDCRSHFQNMKTRHNDDKCPLEMSLAGILTAHRPVLTEIVLSRAFRHIDGGFRESPVCLWK